MNTNQALNTVHTYRQLEATLRDVNLNPTQWQILHLIDDLGPVAMHTLADEMDMSPSGVTRVIDHLVSLSAVKRTESRSDRRSLVASITPAGKRLLVKLDARVTAPAGRAA